MRYAFLPPVWLFVLGLGSLGPVPSVEAHAPHDVIYDIRFSPDYERDGTVYVIARGSFLVSRDRGETWIRRIHGLDLSEGSRLTALEVVPGSPMTLYMTSTRDGVFRSADGGRSWERTGSGPADVELQWIAADPRRPQRIVVGGPRGLFATDTGGRPWRRLPFAGRPTAVVFAPSRSAEGSQIVLGDASNNLWGSADGEQWRRLARIPEGRGIQTLEIVEHVSDGIAVLVGARGGGFWELRTVGAELESLDVSDRGLRGRSVRSLVHIDDFEGSGRAAVLASTRQGGVFARHAGGSWAAVGRGLTLDHQADRGGFPHFSDLRKSPAFARDRTLFLGGFNGLFRSLDGGRRWTELTTLAAELPVDVALLAEAGQPALLAVATYRAGLYISRDRGKTWARSVAGLESPEVENGCRRLYQVEPSPTFSADQTLWVSSRNAVFLSSDGGRSFGETLRFRAYGSSWPAGVAKRWRGVDGAGKPSMAIVGRRPGRHLVFVATREGDVFRSDDSGETFVHLSNVLESAWAARPPRQLAVSPAFEHDRTLFIASYGEIYRSVNGGQSWQWASRGLDIEPKKAQLSVLVSPRFADDQTLFAAGAAGLFVSRDRGETWRRSRDEPLEVLAAWPDPNGTLRLWAGLKGGGLLTAFADRWVPGSTNLAGNSTPSHMALFNVSTSPLTITTTPAGEPWLVGFSGKTLVSSEDGGQTWSHLHLPTDLPEPTTGIALGTQEPDLKSAGMDFGPVLGWTLLLTAGVLFGRRLTFQFVNGRGIHGETKGI